MCRLQATKGEQWREFSAIVWKRPAGSHSQCVHLLVIDLFHQATPRRANPTTALWDEFKEEDLDSRPTNRLTLAPIDAGERAGGLMWSSWGVGDTLPDMPLFLKPQVYVRRAAGIELSNLRGTPFQPPCAGCWNNLLLRKQLSSFPLPEQLPLPHPRRRGRNGRCPGGRLARTAARR